MKSIQKRIFSASLVLFLLVLATSSSYFIGCKSITKKVEHQLNGAYLSQVSDRVKTDVYDEMDEYITNYITNNNISQYFNEQTINQISQNTVKNITSNESSITMNLTEEQKEEVQTMTQNAISSALALYDTENRAKIEQAMAVSEEEKAFISSTVSTIVTDELKKQSIVPNNEGEVTLSEEQIDKKISDAIKEALSGLNVNENPTVTNVSLSEEDKQAIKDEIRSSIDLSAYVTTDTLASMGYVTNDNLQDDISNATTVATELAVEQIYGEIDQKVVDAVRANKPQKGVDYFTEAEVNELKDAVKSSALTTVDEVVADLEMQIAENKQEITSVKQTISTLENSLNTTNSQLSELISDYDENKQKIENLTSDATDIQTNIDELKNRLNTLESNQFDVSSFNSFKTEIKNEVQDLSDKYGNLKQDVEDFETSTLTKLSTLDGKITALDESSVSESDYQTLKANYENFVTTTTEGFDSLNASITRLGDEKLNKSELDETTNKIGELSGKFTTFESSFTTFSAETTDKLNGLEEDINILERSASGNTDSISALRTEFEEFNSSTGTRLTDLEASIEDLGGAKLSKSDFETYVASNDTKVKKLSDNYSALKQEYDAFVTSSNNTISDMQRKLETLEGSSVDKETYRQLNTAFETFKSETETTIEAMGTTIETLGNSKLNSEVFETYQQENDGKVNDLTTKHDSLKADFDTAKSEIDSSIKSITDKLGDTDFTTADYKTISDGIKSLQSEIDAFQTTYDTTTRDINDDIASLQNSVGVRTGALANYSGTLWKKADELQTVLNTKASVDSVDALSSDLNAYKQTVTDATTTMQGDIDGINEDLATKLDKTEFEAYCNGVDAQISDLDTKLNNLSSNLEQTKTDLSTLRTEFDDIKNTVVPNLKKSIADDFSESTSYSVGDYCYYDGLMYKCKVAGKNGWDESKWEQTQVSDELVAMQGEITQLNNSLDEKLSFTNQKEYRGSAGVINAFSNKEITIDISELGLTRKPIVIPQNTYTGGMGITNITTTSIKIALFNCYNYAIEFYYGILVLY